MLALSPAPTRAFTGLTPILLRRLGVRASARVFHTRGALVVFAGKKGARAKNKDSGRSIHFREGPDRFNAGGVGSVQRGGQGSGKTTRSQRTNKVYKTYLSGRPTVDDVERASLGDRTKAMGVVERDSPYRLNNVNRETWERAKRRGGHGFGDGTGGGGVLEIRTTATSSLAPHRHPLVNTHRLFCDAKHSVFVVIEQEDAGRDDVVVDLSTLRVGSDGPIRRRIMEIAGKFGSSITNVVDLCHELGEPLEAQVRYISKLESQIVVGGDEGETTATDAAGSVLSFVSSKSCVVEPVPGGLPLSVASAETAVVKSPLSLALAETAVAETADVIRAMKDAGATNATDEVRRAVAELLALKQILQLLKETEAASTPDAVSLAEKESESTTARWQSEARRSIQELPIHNLPERYLRFTCEDRPTAKTLAKEIANERVYHFLTDGDEDEGDEEVAPEGLVEAERVTA